MRRKGIEPIVSVVLLLLITIALAGGVLVWLNGYVGGLQGDFTTKGTVCLRINDTHVKFRGYMVSTSDNPLTAGSVAVSQLGGPVTNSTLSPSALPTTTLQAGQQVLFEITANNTATTKIPRGTYTLEFAGNAIERISFNCV